MRLKNRLFTAFLLFAFFPIAILSFIGLELLDRGLERVTSPGIQSAIQSADSVIELGQVELEDRCVRALSEVPSGVLGDMVGSVFDFAMTVSDSDTTLNSVISDSITIETILGGLLGEDGQITRTRFRIRDGFAVMGIRRALDSVIAAGYILGPEYASSHSAFGDHLYEFDRVRLLKESRKRFMRLLWLAFNLSFLVVILVVSRVTARGFTKPLAGLEKLVERVGPGSWDVSLEYKRKDEVGSLVAGFNRMSVRLAETTEKLIHAEKTAAWQQTARVIAHGIKNVLAPVKLAIARLEKDSSISASDPSSPLTTIQSELDLLERSAKDFSMFGRPVALNLKTSDINAVVRQAVRICDSKDPRIQMKVSLAEETPPVMMDAELIREATINLIKNAQESSDEAVEIQISTSLEKGRAVITVADNGGGINSELEDRIFEPYITGKSGGTGLGLAIVKKVVDSCGGTISHVTSPHGTSFRIWLEVANESSG